MTNQQNRPLSLSRPHPGRGGAPLEGASRRFIMSRLIGRGSRDRKSNRRLAHGGACCVAPHRTPGASGRRPGVRAQDQRPRDHRRSLGARPARPDVRPDIVNDNYDKPITAALRRPFPVGRPVPELARRFIYELHPDQP